MTLRDALPVTDGETEAQEAGASRRLMKGPRQTENRGPLPAASAAGGLILGVTEDSEAGLSVPFSSNLSSLSHTYRLIKYFRDTRGRTGTMLFVEGIRVKENLLLVYVLIHGAGKGTCLTSRRRFVYSLINMCLFTHLFIRYLSFRHSLFIHLSVCLLIH